MFNAIRTWFVFLSYPLLRGYKCTDFSDASFSFRSSFLTVIFGASIVLCLGGCGTAHHDVSVAPMPIAASYDFDRADTDVVVPPNVPAGRALHVQNQNTEILNAVSYKSDAPEKKTANCSIKDRIDRDALIAYEWSRNRLSMDVDGMSGGDTGMMLTYKIRLQPEKTKAQKCRYGSKWQGMIGSGYNELMVRDDDTLQDHFGKMRREFFDHLNNSF